MNKELFLSYDYQRIKDYLLTEQTTSLGIGFFSSNKSHDPNNGIEIISNPKMLLENIYKEIGHGNISPLLPEVLMFGDLDANKQTLPEYIPLCLWLMIGLHSITYSECEFPSKVQFLSKEFKNTSNLSELIFIFMQEIETKVLKLRVSNVFFILDLNIIYPWFKSIYNAKFGQDLNLNKEELIIELLTWFIEDSLHPKIIILSSNIDEYYFILQHAKIIKANRKSNINIRLNI